MDSRNDFTATATGKPAGKVLQWLGWAERDYVSARILLLRKFLVQGSAFANTAIEKYFKALVLIAGQTNPRNHDLPSLKGELVAAFPNLFELNDEFLAALTKAYRLRYPDKLEIGFNLHLSQAKTLVELDRTAARIRRGFRFGRQNGNPVEFGVDVQRKANSVDLLEHNCSFGNAQRSQVFAELRNCYEVRVLEDGSILEIDYEATEIDDDQRFLVEGLKQRTRESAQA